MNFFVLVIPIQGAVDSTNSAYGEGLTEVLTAVFIIGLMGIAAVLFLNNHTMTLRRRRKPEAGTNPSASEHSTVTPEAPKKPSTQVPLPAISKGPSINGCDKKEKRKHLRRHGRPVDILITKAPDTAPPEKGEVVDRSRSGVRLVVPKQYTVGTVLYIRALEAPDTASWIEVKIRWCRNKGNQWQIGGQFTQELAWGVLLLFG
jgi:hypothetical protein